MRKTPRAPAAARQHARTTSATAPDTVPGVLESPPLVEIDAAESQSEAELLEGTSTRIVDGRTKKENLRVIFEHITSADDERRLKRSERNSREMGLATLSGQGVGRKVLLPKRCEKHGTPGCTPCRLLEESLHTIVPGSVPQLITLEPPASKKEMKKKISARQRKREEKIAAELAARRSDEALADVKERENSKKMQFQIIQNVRKEYGYDARDLAKFLDQPGFNTARLATDFSLLDTDMKFVKLQLQIVRKERKRAPRTMVDLHNMLPLKVMPLFSDEEIALYKGCAARNRKAKDPDALLELENRIIHRAWDLGLLPRKRALRPDDFDRDLNENYDLEIMSGSFGDTTVSTGFTSTGQLKQTSSFERGPVHQDRRSGKGAPEDGGASLDDAADGDVLD